MPRITYIAPDDAQPWERQTGESAPAYEAWITYLDLPPQERSLSRLASDLGKSGTVVAGWSSLWGWQDRLAAWQTKLDREKQRAAIDAVRGAGIRQAAQLEAIGRVLFEPVQILLKRIAAGEAKLDQLTDGELIGLSILTARAFPRLVVAERLVRGQPTDIIETADEQGTTHIPAEAQWNRDFYGTLEELGIEPSTLMLPPGVDVGQDLSE